MRRFWRERMTQTLDSSEALRPAETSELLARSGFSDRYFWSVSERGIERVERILRWMRSTSEAQDERGLG